MIPHSMIAALNQLPFVDRKQGFALFAQGELPVGLWMLESGELHITRFSVRGKAVVLDVLEAGDFAGLASAVSNFPYETAAETAGNCRLRMLPRADFLKVMHGDAESSACIAALLAEELAVAHRWIGNTTLARSGAARLANFLLSSPKSELRSITHNELSLRIGLSREVVTRILRQFRDSGAISPVRGTLAVQDRLLLAKVAS